VQKHRLICTDFFLFPDNDHIRYYKADYNKLIGLVTRLSRSLKII